MEKNGSKQSKLSDCSVNDEKKSESCLRLHYNNDNFKRFEENTVYTVHNEFNETKHPFCANQVDLKVYNNRCCN